MLALLLHFLVHRPVVCCWHDCFVFVFFFLLFFLVPSSLIRGIHLLRSLVLTPLAVLNTSPGNVDACLALSELYEGAGQLDRALQVLRTHQLETRKRRPLLTPTPRAP